MRQWGRPRFCPAAERGRFISEQTPGKRSAGRASGRLQRTEAVADSEAYPTVSRQVNEPSGHGPAEPPRRGRCTSLLRRTVPLGAPGCPRLPMQDPNPLRAMCSCRHCNASHVLNPCCVEPEGGPEVAAPHSGLNAGALWHADAGGGSPAQRTSLLRGSRE